MARDPRLREAAWLVLAVVAQAAITAVIASRSGWQTDDFTLFRDAAFSGRYDLDYLAGPAIVHFSPGHRLVSLVLQRHAPFDYGAALAFLIVAQATSVVLAHRIVRWFAGPVWWSFPVVFAFGLSPIVFTGIEWYAAGVLIVPPTALTLAAIHAYLHWTRSRHRAWLAWSVVAVAGALAFYEKAALVPVYLVLVRVLVLDQDRPLGENVRGAVREWRVWAPYVVLVALWYVAYRSRPYAQSWQLGNLGEDLAFLRISWLEAFVPGTFGLRITGAEPGWQRLLAVLVTQALVVGAVALTVRRRRAAWRPWALLAIAFLLGAALVFPRVAEWAPGVSGHVLRYHIEALALVPLVLAAAVGRRPASGPTVWWPRAAGLAALALFTVVAIGSASAHVDDSPGPVGKRYLANLRADIERAQQRAPVVNLLDGRVPDRIIAWWGPPGTYLLSLNVPVFRPGVVFDQAVDPIYDVRPDGHLQQVRFRPYLGGEVQELLDKGAAKVVGTTPSPARPGEQGVCLQAGGGPAALELPPQRVVRGRKWYLRVAYTTGPRQVVEVAVNRGVPPGAADLRLGPAPESKSVFLELGALPDGPPTYGGLRFDVPAGSRACLRRVEVGAFDRAGG